MHAKRVAAEGVVAEGDVAEGVVAESVAAEGDVAESVVADCVDVVIVVVDSVHFHDATAIPVYLAEVLNLIGRLAYPLQSYQGSLLQS